MKIKGRNESECKRLAILNEKFFSDVELTEQEEKKILWLCSWDQETIQDLTSAFEKAMKKKNNRNAGRKADEPKKEKILEMKESGKNITQIAKELNCSRQNIYRILNREGE